MRTTGQRLIPIGKAAGFGACVAALLACGAPGPTPSSGTNPTAISVPAAKPPLRQAIAKAMALSGLRSVAFAVVTSDGHVFPERLIVRKNLHYVVWIGDGDTLDIKFKDPTDLPVPECKDAVCWVSQIGRESGPDGFPYKGTIQTGPTPPVVFDPRLEVVK